MGITLQKIAKLANVSVSTASKALHHSKEINEETASVVREIALQYGYQINKKNVLLKNQKRITPRIAILCPEIVSVYYSNIATKMARHLEEAGAITHIFISDFGEKSRWETLKKCFESMEINGAVGLFEDKFDEDIGLPFVCMGKSKKFGCVFGDIAGGILQAVSAAKARGHERFLFLSEHLTASKEKYFNEALEKIGVSPKNRKVFVSEYRFEEAGAKGMTAILERGDPLPDFCLCAYDEIGIGAMKVLREKGICIPEDIAVMGINDVPAAQYVSPALSSMEFDKDILCDSVANLILEAVLSEKPMRPQEVVLPYRLCLRESFR